MSDHGTTARDDGVGDAAAEDAAAEDADGQYDDAADSVEAGGSVGAADSADDADGQHDDAEGASLPPGIEDPSDTVEGSGRPYLVGAAGVVTVFAAAAGYVVAANNAVGAVTVFGLVTLPGSPAAMALYGAVLSLLVLGVLFGLVGVASRFDDAAN